MSDPQQERGRLLGRIRARQESAVWRPNRIRQAGDMILLGLAPEDTVLLPQEASA